MNLSQNDTGRAFEYGILKAFAERLPARLDVNPQYYTAKQCFENCSDSEKENIVKASRAKAQTIARHPGGLFYCPESIPNKK